MMKKLLMNGIINISIFSAIFNNKYIEESLYYDGKRIKHWQLIWITSFSLSVILSLYLVYFFRLNLFLGILLIFFNTPILPIVLAFLYQDRKLDYSKFFENHKYELLTDFPKRIKNFINLYALYIHPLKMFTLLFYLKSPSEEIINKFYYFYIIFALTLFIIKLVASHKIE